MPTRLGARDPGVRAGQKETRKDRAAPQAGAGRGLAVTRARHPHISFPLPPETQGLPGRPASPDSRESGLWPGQAPSKGMKWGPIMVLCLEPSPGPRGQELAMASSRQSTLGLSAKGGSQRLHKPNHRESRGGLMKKDPEVENLQGLVGPPQKGPWGLVQGA